MTRECIVYDNDKSYGKRLLSVISKKCGSSLNFSLFTEWEELKKYLLFNNAEVLIISCENDILLDNLKVDKIIILSEEEKSEINNEKYGREVKLINKYQPVEQIIREFMGYTGNAANSISKTQIIGFYSPVYHELQTKFALSMAKVMSERGKTLFINLEEFAGLDKVIPDIKGMNLSDALYIFRQNGFKVDEKISDMICSAGGIDYFAPVKCADDITFAGVSQIGDFIEKIGAYGNYDFIIVDISSLTARQWRFIKFCDVVYMPLREDEHSHEKIMEFESYCLMSGLENLLVRIKKTQIPKDSTELENNYFEHTGNGRLYEFAGQIC